MKPKYFKYLDISTAHMTKLDNERLKDGISAVICIPYEYGYRIHISKENHEEILMYMKEAGLSPDFIKIIEWAHKEGMDWVEFDADGTVYPHLEQHTW